MTFDGLTLAAMTGELQRKLVGARVQKVVQPDAVGVALELYGQRSRAWLVLSADPQQPRLYLASEKPGRGVETPSPLLLLLRKHVEGLRLGEIAQPPGERIVRFGFFGHALDGSVEPATLRFRLIIEAISQYSNLILVDAAGQVLDAARRVTAEQNRARVTLPHQPYVPPPTQNKRSLVDADDSAVLAVLQAAAPGATIWQTLVAGFAGIGPLGGREIVYRALGDTRARLPDGNVEPIAERVAAALHQIVQPVFDGSFEASVAFGEAPVAPSPADAESAKPEAAPPIVAFAPYALTHLDRWEARPSLSAAAEQFYRQARSATRLDLARREIAVAFDAERKLAQRKRESLLRAMVATTRADELRQRGELLLTYSSAIPRGASSYHADGNDLELDPRLTAVENAQACFRRYRKAQSALREVPALLAEVELRLRYLDELDAWANLAESADDVRSLRSELRPVSRRQNQPVARRRARRPDEGVLRLKTPAGAEILVGRSAQQNHFVTFELGRADDVWLHARGCPGAHVILRADAAGPSPTALREAAQLAAYYSTNRTAGRVAVDWTRRKHVRRLGKGTPGLVSYSGEETIVVPPLKPGDDDS
jgi:predicted ribosome quality control (RQC) complex YloA/Tae2 family protein